jgi:hydroxyacylglutathione hydrolase
MLSALPAFADNYIWMLRRGQQALVVDPGDAAPVKQALQSQGLQLAAILVTHHHPDHTGGIAALRPLLQGRVYGPALEAITGVDVALHDGDEIEELGHRFQVIDVPGHTAGHIAYFEQAQGGQAPLLFCGDTLFSAGCGRLFEGTPAQMLQSLSRLAALPGDTRVCCTHEYTLSNLRFAAAVEPGNAQRAQHQAACEQQRAQGQPTLPSTIALELQINPFLRCTEPEVVASALAQGALGPEALPVFSRLREWKNRF